MVQQNIIEEKVYENNISHHGSLILSYVGVQNNTLQNSCGNLISVSIIRTQLQNTIFTPAAL